MADVKTEKTPGQVEAETLDVVVPTVKTIKLGDKHLPLVQIKVKQLPQLMKALRPITGVVRTVYEQMKAGKKMDPATVMDLIMLYTDDALALLTVLMQVDREWLDQQEIDEVAQVGMAFVEVHVDFFVEKVLPLLSVAVQAAKRAQSSEAPEKKDSTSPEDSKDS